MSNLSQFDSDPIHQLRYYRHCLADGERMDIHSDAIRNKGCLVPADRILTKLLVQKLFADLPEDEPSRDILYCPLCLQQSMKDGGKASSTTVYPFWIPAILARTGELRPPRDDIGIPWLVRGVLAPNEYLNREYPVLSSVERVDRVGTTLQIDRANWKVYLASALDYFRGCSR